MFYRSAEHFSVKALHTYGSNVIHFHLDSGDRQWFIVGYYLAPSDASTIEDVFTKIIQRPQGDMLVVVGYFNTDLAAP